MIFNRYRSADRIVLCFDTRLAAFKSSLYRDAYIRRFRFNKITFVIIRSLRFKNTAYIFRFLLFLYDGMLERSTVKVGYFSRSIQYLFIIMHAKHTRYKIIGNRVQPRYSRPVTWQYAPLTTYLYNSHSTSIISLQPNAYFGRSGRHS